MKKKFYVQLAAISFLILSLTSAQGQDESYVTSLDDFTSLTELNSDSYFYGAMGYTRLGDENYAGIRLQPELSFGKVGIGLDIPVYFNLETGDFWSDEYKNGVGVMRLISYFRYGRKKHDPVFFKVGVLQGERIGYGSLVNNYGNSISSEQRKMGVVYDIMIKKVFGIEGLYSDFNVESFNLFAIRPYVRPFGRTNIPVIKTLDFGFTYVTDRDKTDRLSGQKTPNMFLEKGMTAWGLDMGMTVINSSVINVGIYAQYSKLNEVKSLTDYYFDYYTNYDPMSSIIPPPPHPYPNTTIGYDAGDGYGVGFDANMKIIGNVFRMNTRVERLWYSKNYLPQFFSAIYEIDKDAQIAALGNAPKKEGIYGSLTASFIDKILVGGNLLIPDNISETSPALLQLNLQTVDLFEKINIHGSYTKGNITKMGDALKFDESSLAKMRFTYKISPLFVTGVEYSWTWVEEENGNFKVKNMVAPYFAISIPFNK